MEVHITSKEWIKPSSPTPQHLRTHKLSLLDQFAPPVYIPMVLYYPNPNPNPLLQEECLAEKEEEDPAAGCSRSNTTLSINNINTNTSSNNIVEDAKIRSQLLKQSLSKTLTHFYPLAGRIKDHLSIDCNDQGAYYVEARADSHLTHFLSNPPLSLISKFLPSPSTWDGPTPGAPVSMIQVTLFPCGGLVIGVTISHMVLDASSTSVFLKAWAAMAGDHTNHHQADQADQAEACTHDHPIIVFDAASVFPPSVAYPREANLTALWHPFFKMGKSATRRFLFDAPAIARLKANAATASNTNTSSCRVGVQNPTRVEVVSALIWKCANAAFQAKSGGLAGRPSLVAHTVNLRQRAVPQLPQSLMGNLFWLAHSVIMGDDHKHTDDDQLSSCIRRLREAKLKIDEEFVRKLQGLGGFEHLTKVVKEDAQGFSSVASSGDGISFTSLCGFGFYHTDFGWGKPAWISSVGSPELESRFTNIVTLLDTRWGEGIEAWVILDAQVLGILEQDPQLLAFASLCPAAFDSTNIC